jgi:CheY-like chemotaxis protein
MILLTAKALEPDSTRPLEVLQGLGIVPLRKILSKPFSPRDLIETARSLVEAGAATT